MPRESIKGFYEGGSFPRGTLWSQPEILGTTLEEFAAYNRGELDLYRSQQIMAALAMASRGLETIQPRGRA